MGFASMMVNAVTDLSSRLAVALNETVLFERSWLAST